MEEKVMLSHGGGGTLTRDLVDRIFVKAYGNRTLSFMEDAACLSLPGGEAALTTDVFVVNPLFFPGGDIGRLAVAGTVNDLAVTGAEPRALAAGFVLEEGLPLETLERVAQSMARAAREGGVEIVAGDTKVVGRGAADGMFITTTGVGIIPEGRKLGPARIQPGDRILVSGTLGDHGVAVMSQREGIRFQSAVDSDVAPLADLISTMTRAGTIHALRDPTRGGAAAAINELAEQAGVGVELEEEAVPIRVAVDRACALLGLDPFTVANEGKVVAFVPSDAAEAVLSACRDHPLGRDAALIGEAVAEHPGRVVMTTRVGGRKVVEMPYGEGLPRIC